MGSVVTVDIPTYTLHSGKQRTSNMRVEIDNCEVVGAFPAIRNQTIKMWKYTTKVLRGFQITFVSVNSDIKLHGVSNAFDLSNINF